MPKMLSKSRFCRRLKAIADLAYDLFHQLGWLLKQIDGKTQFLIDSIGIALCHNIGIPRSRLVQSEHERGYIVSKRCYFYGIRIQLLTPKDGIPVEFAFLPGAADDSRGLHALLLALPLGSQVFGDSAYTDYQTEELLPQQDDIQLMVFRCSPLGVS